MADSMGRHFPHRHSAPRESDPVFAISGLEFSFNFWRACFAPSGFSRCASWASLLSPSGFPPQSILLGLLSYRNCQSRSPDFNFSWMARFYSSFMRTTVYRVSRWLEPSRVIDTFCGNLYRIAALWTVSERAFEPTRKKTLPGSKAEKNRV